MHKTIFVLLLLTFLEGQVYSDVITGLPGLNTTLNFKQYSGYITVNATKGTRLFYWLVESQSNPAKDPLVLWLNGGPGCSSLGGFWGELGPFYVKSNSTLGLNMDSWNKVANMVFLEAPAGVGFSKTDEPIAYTDEKTASDSLQFLLKFFEMYPHLKGLDFWMTGESYAGHYIPTLAKKVVEHNDRHSSGNVINLKGLMIGNPLTVLSINNGGTVDYIYSHQLISMATYEGLHQFCNYSFPGGPRNTVDPQKCAEYQMKSSAEMGNINPYDIYADVCLGDAHHSFTNGEALLKVVARSKTGYTFLARQLLKTTMKLKSPYYPCQDNYIQTYLNNPAVQKAIHAETTKWTDCNDAINLEYSQDDVAASMLPIYNHTLLGRGLKILIYSGDVDSVVPATSTRRCLRLLERKVTEAWKPWIDSKGQVGGYVEVQDGITYATVRNAGHEVPSYQPGRAFDLFSTFLQS